MSCVRDEVRTDCVIWWVVEENTEGLTRPSTSAPTGPRTTSFPISVIPRFKKFSPKPVLRSKN